MGGRLTGIRWLSAIGWQIDWDPMAQPASAQLAGRLTGIRIHIFIHAIIHVYNTGSRGGEWSPVQVQFRNARGQNWGEFGGRWLFFRTYTSGSFYPDHKPFLPTFFRYQGQTRNLTVLIKGPYFPKHRLRTDVVLCHSPLKWFNRFARKR